LRRLKIVIDAGNGVAGLTLKHLAKKLPLKIIPFNWQPDGRFLPINQIRPWPKYQAIAAAS
jgi:phosphomannomutase